VNYAEVYNLLRARRSARKYLNTCVSKADIEKIIAAAVTAPSPTNAKNWRFVAVTSDEIKKKMVEAVKQKVDFFAKKINSEPGRVKFKTYSNYFTFFDHAPVVMLIIKKPYDSIAHRIAEKYGFGGFLEDPSEQGVSAAVQNMLLAATSLGYGTCWMTGPLIAKDELHKITGITAPDEILATVPKSEISTEDLPLTYL
jgi:nitroreductase